MKGLTDFNKQCIYDCYNLMRDCVNFEHIEDFEFIDSAIKKIERYKIALPSEVYKQINSFIIENLHPILDDPCFFSAIESPKFGNFNKDGVFEINSDESLNQIIYIMAEISADIAHKIDSFAEQYMVPYLI